MSFWKRIFGLYKDDDLRIGMTEDELIAIWGQPNSKDRSSDKRNDQWWYKTGILQGYFCYFTSGKLQNWNYRD